MDFSSLIKRFPKVVEWYWNRKWKRGNVSFRMRSDSNKYSLVNEKLLVSVGQNFVWNTPRFFGSDEHKAFNCFVWVKKNIKYVSDKSQYGLNEFWATPEEVFKRKRDDCFAGYEKIYTKNGLKKISDLKIGEEVLSYDFKKKDYVYKCIVNFWSKGKLQVNRVHFRNGQSIDVSEDHPMWHRKLCNCDTSDYEKQKLSDIDLSRWWEKKVPTVKKLPYKIKDVDFLNNDLCFVIGHFLAEGSVSKSHVETSGYDVIDKIIPLLEKNSIPFSEGKNGNGVPILRFLTSDFKELLKTFKGKETLSFSGFIPEWFFHLPISKLRSLLNGYFLGDGHDYSKASKDYKTNIERIYSTSSHELAKGLCRLSLQLGKPLYCWKQEHHGGCGNKPIWRLSYNPNSYFLKDYGYEGLSETSISFIEKLDLTEMFDLTVKDTHTVIMENGIITHQCEGGAHLLMKLLEFNNVPAWRRKLCAGHVELNGELVGHAYVIFLGDDFEWYVLDWCYWSNLSERCWLKTPHRKIKKYGSVWFTFNEELIWCKHDYVLNGVEDDYNV